MIAGPAHLRKAAVEEEVQQQQLNIFNDMANGDRLADAKLLTYAKREAKEELANIERKIDQKFVSDFTEWLRGAKDAHTAEEHHKAGWNPDTINGPISDHPSVKSFLDQHYERRLEFTKKLAEMKLRGGRMNTDSRKGKGMTIDDAWKYYKYVVRNMPQDDNEDDDHGTLPDGWSVGVEKPFGASLSVAQAPQRRIQAMPPAHGADAAFPAEEEAAEHLAEQTGDDFAERKARLLAEVQESRAQAADLLERVARSEAEAERVSRENAAREEVIRKQVEDMKRQHQDLVDEIRKLREEDEARRRSTPQGKV
jgi:hypothetical protein